MHQNGGDDGRARPRTTPRSAKRRVNEMEQSVNHHKLQTLRYMQTQTNANDQEDDQRLQYWDNLRNSSTFETRQGSAMFRINTPNETVRLAHLLSIHPYSEILANGDRIPVDELAYVEASSFLAVHHFNERSPAVLPDLPELLGDCNVYLTVDIVDTILSPIVASRKALEYFVRPKGSLSKPPPISLAGATRSAVSQPLSVLAGVYHTPMVNSQSTSSVLDNKDSSPTFTRAIPTNRVDAKAVVTYFQSLGVNHFGVLFVRDSYGSEFDRDLKAAAAEQEMSVVSAAYNDGDEQSVVGALEKLRRSQLRYFFAVLTASPERHAFVITEASRLGMMGNPEYVWFFGEASTLLLEESFFKSNRKIAASLSGSGLILLDIPQNERFNEALQDLGRNAELYEYYVSRHDAPEMFDGFDWQPLPGFYDQTSYDATIALGIALCNMTEEFPSGPAVVDAVKATEFVGTSGFVSFDNITGTRTAESVSMKVVNLLIHSTEQSIQHSTSVTSMVKIATGEVENISPFIYSQGGTQPPMSLPPTTYQINLLGDGIRALGWSLSALVIFVSVGFGIWTYHIRKREIVRVAQPFFLGLLCAGTILMASTIIPVSFQEPMSQETLDKACMSVPWLFVIGFATAFSSLYCKLHRLNKVFSGSAGMQRVEVKAKDVIRPFVVLFIINFALLLAWTLVAPLRWIRVEVANYDRFGRSVESFGTCFSTDPNGSSLELSSRNAFLITLGLFNFVVVVFANYQCYLARRVPSDFNESYYIGLSMLSILEGFLIGIPILFLCVGKPSASFVVSSVLIAFLCLAILLPTFVPKTWRRRHSLDRSEWNQTWRSYRYDKNVSRRCQNDTHNGSSLQKSSVAAVHRDSVAAIRDRVARSIALQQNSQDKLACAECGLNVHV